MPKSKKSDELDQILQSSEKETVKDFVSTITPPKLDEIEEPVEKTDIREIAKKAVEAKGVVATEQHINDYIERFNLA